MAAKMVAGAPRPLCRWGWPCFPGPRWALPGPRRISRSSFWTEVWRGERGAAAGDGGEPGTLTVLTDPAVVLVLVSQDAGRSMEKKWMNSEHRQTWGDLNSLQGVFTEIQCKIKDWDEPEYIMDTNAEKLEDWADAVNGE